MSLVNDQENNTAEESKTIPEEVSDALEGCKKMLASGATFKEVKQFVWFD